MGALRGQAVANLLGADDGNQPSAAQNSISAQEQLDAQLAQ